MKTIIHTVDDEEPNCNRCCHVNRDEAFCMERCGSEHAWFGYGRVENIEE